MLILKVSEALVIDCWYLFSCVAKGYDDPICGFANKAILSDYQIPA